MPSKDPCSDLARVITRLAMNVGERPEVKNLDHVVSVLQEHIPEITRDSLVASINEATTGRAAARSELGKKLDELKREARRDVALRVSITELQRTLERGEMPATTPREPSTPAPEIATLTERRDAVLSALKKSDPAIRQRFERQIENLTDRLETGVTLPEPKVVTPLSREAARLEYQRDLLRKEVRRQMDALRPTTIWGRVAEPFNAVRAVMTSMDFSGFLRQGGFVVLSHPIRSARALPEMFKAFASDEASYRSGREIAARPNAPLYAKAKLFLSDIGQGGLSKQEENFVSRLAGKVPLVRASERAYVTVLNRLRADSFDALVNTLGRDGAVTKAEGEAIANFVNVVTGRGKLAGSMEKAADAMNTVFFAPRWVISRMQTAALQPLYKGTMATRRAIVAEYARYLGGVGVVLGLGALAGGTIETDWRSSDFGKIRFGNTRLDPFSAITQPIVLAGRIWTGETKSAKGEIRSLRNPKFGQDSTGDVVWRFLRGKFSPVVGAAWDIAEGKNVVGVPTTPASTFTRLAVPLSFGDVYETMREQGVPRGTALGLAALFGMSVNTYSQGKDKDTHFEKDIKAAWKAISE